ncbi:MAG: hypothetical protein ACOCRK_04935 [bacterium]
MPTSSFNKTYVVSDRKVVKQLREELSKKRNTFNKPSKKYYEQSESGKELLEKILSVRGKIYE